MDTDSEKAEAQTTFWVGRWQVEPASLRLYRDGEEVKVEPKVMEVLVYMTARPGQVITREDLERDIWTGTVVGYDALTSTIIKLRKALQDDSRNPSYIETIPKKGYRLLAEVAAASRERQQKPGSTVPTEISPVPWRMGATILGAILAIAFIYLIQPSGDDTTGKASSDRPAIVVLPFINLNRDPEQQYFSDGMTDDLINDLSGYAGLNVIARRSAYIYKQRAVDIQTIARDLGVKYVVDGNIRRDGQHIRVNVQLVDADRDANIWAQRFDRQATDIFRVQDEIRESIVKALSVTLTREEQERVRRRYTESFEAYDFFLKGQAKLVTRASAGDNDQARELMEQAMALDPGFARAWAALALIHADAYRFDWTDNPEQTRQLALKTGQRAIELDNLSPEAHWILAYIYLFLFEDHEKSIEFGTRAAHLAPGNMDAANVLAVAHSFSGSASQAKLIVDQLMKHHNQYSAMVPSVLGLANFVMGNYAEALTAYNESLLINPSRINPNVYKIVVLYRMGEIGEAEFQALQLYALHPDFDLKVWASRQPFLDKQFVNDMVEDLVKAGVRR